MRISSGNRLGLRFQDPLNILRFQLSSSDIQQLSSHHPHHITQKPSAPVRDRKQIILEKKINRFDGAHLIRCFLQAVGIKGGKVVRTDQILCSLFHLFDINRIRALIRLRPCKHIVFSKVNTVVVPF